MDRRNINNKEKKKSSLLGCTVIMLVIIAIIAGLGLWGYNFYSDATSEPFTSQAEGYQLTIEEGESFLGVVESLEEVGVLKNALAVQIYSRLGELNPQIRFGTYRLSQDLTIESFIELLEKGTLKEGVRVTFQEGLRYEQMAEILGEEQASFLSFTESRFLEIAENPDSYVLSESAQNFLDTYKPAGESLRGYLYPDTYEFGKDASEEAIISLMVENLIAKLESANVDLDNLSLEQSNVTNLYEALTLASIIDKESRGDDRDEISSVFHNRLSEGGSLNSDATVNFFTGKNDAGVLFTDRDTPNPYNTYLNPGLPPGPINNPRIESILAAFYPAETGFFYFYHTPDGQIFLNTNLTDHTNGVCRDLGCG